MSYYTTLDKQKQLQTSKTWSPLSDIPLWLQSVGKGIGDWASKFTPTPEQRELLRQQQEAENAEEERQRQIFFSNIQNTLRPPDFTQARQEAQKVGSDIADWARNINQMNVGKSMFDVAQPQNALPQVLEAVSPLFQAIQKGAETVYSQTPLFGKDIRETTGPNAMSLEEYKTKVNPKVEGWLGDLGVTKLGVAGILGDPTNLLLGMGGPMKFAGKVNILDDVVKLLVKGTVKREGILKALMESPITKAKIGRNLALSEAENLLKTAEAKVAQLGKGIKEAVPGVTRGAGALPGEAERVLKGTGKGITKEPWQMTRGDYLNQTKGSLQRMKGISEENWGRSLDEAADAHREMIATSLKEGKPVPPEVLKDYPDLMGAGGTIPPKPIVEPIKPSGMKESEHFRKVNEKLRGELGDNPLYSTINIEEQTAKGIQFVADNPIDARKIALGLKKPPPGILDTAISRAYEQRLFDAGDIKGFTEAVNSISMRKTRAGQEIAALKGAVNDNSPTHFIEQVIAARTEEAAKKLPKTPGKPTSAASRVTQSIDNEVYKMSKLPKEELKKRVGKTLFEQIEELDKLGDTEGKTALLNDFMARKLGIEVTEQEVKSIAAQVGEVNKLLGKLDPILGVPDVDYWVARKALDDLVNGFIPVHQLKVATSTIGRGTMLFSVKSPLVNIVSNTVQGLIEGFGRRITNKAYRGFNGNFAKTYIKKVNEIYQKSGYDISRLDAEWMSQMRLGEEITHAQGPGIVRKVGRFYEDFVFKQLMGAPDVASSSIAFADSADLMSTKIAQMEGKGIDRALDIFKDAVKIQPETVEGNLVRSQSIADARFSTYTNKSGYADVAMSIRKLLNKMSGDIRLGDQLMPFVKTPANVVSVAMDTAGIGAFKGLYRLPNALKAMKAGDVAPMRIVVRDFTRAGFGLTLAAVLAYAINPEDFVGDYDSLSSKEREMAALKGAPYNSVRIGGKYISLDYMGPLASAFVGIMYARKYGENMPEKIAQYIKGASGQLLRFPGLTEVSDMIAGVKDAVASGDIGKTIEGISDEGIAFIRARVIPGIVSDFTRGLDSTERTTGKSALSKTMAGIPGLRQTLPEKISKTTGEPLKGEGLLSTILFGSRVRTAQDNTTIDEINRLYGENAAPTITDIDKSSKRVQQLKAELGDQGFTEALRFYGSQYGTEANRLIETPWYQELTDEEKMKELNSIRSDAVDEMIRKYQRTEILKPLTIQQQVNDAGKYIERQVWSQYPVQMKAISDQITKLENSDNRSDKIKARDMLMQYPQILQARRIIAQQKILLKRQLIMGR